MAFLKVLLAALLWGLAALQPCLGQSRIIGGKPVLNNRFPYFAKLRIVFLENGQQYVTYCGGALVTSDTVLTVAHCLVNPKIVSISVTLGTYSDTPNSASQKIKAASWTPHPKYDGTLKTSDIGVVKLSQKVVIAPIKLSFTSGFPKQGRNVTVIGDDSNSLSQVQLLVRNWDDCYKLYAEVDGTAKICAGGNGKNACAGDSGGPMVVRGQSRSGDVFAGIVSHGPNPCKDLPVVYTRVSSYKDWIRKEACISWTQGR